MLADYKVPRRWYVVDELPRNATGKVLKAQLIGRLVHLPLVSPATGRASVPPPSAARKAARTLLACGGAALAAEYLPSVVTLGQWAPMRSLPGVCAAGGDRGDPMWR